MSEYKKGYWKDIKITKDNENALFSEAYHDMQERIKFQYIMLSAGFDKIKSYIEDSATILADNIENMLEDVIDEMNDEDGDAHECESSLNIIKANIMYLNNKLSCDHLIEKIVCIKNIMNERLPEDYEEEEQP